MSDGRSIDWGALRAQFPILERKVYLNSNSLGALSRLAIEERRRFEALWNERGASAWYEIWLAKLEEVRAAFGRTIGAEPGTIALMPSVSAALAVVAGALDGAARSGDGADSVGGRPPVGRRKVVVTELDFPTLGHQFLSRRALGLEVEVVESPDGVEVPLEAIAAAVDEDTLLLATSHVFYGTGAIQDARALAEIAHGAGSYILLDAYQSNGQLPIDVGALGVDFLVSGALKWLCGGPGLAYLYVRPGIDLAPTTLSWFGVEDQFGFDLRGARARADARRFELGTPAMGAVYTAAGGLAVVEEAGIERIRARDRGLADDLRGRLREAGFALHEASAPERRSALVLVHQPEAAAVVGALA
ncbi:MAG: aminotransferase class V-fold PLP-dependent enzyme, partial [Gemmatimonadota bacterium]